MRSLRWILLISLLIFGNVTQAGQTLVLIHGYLGTGTAWRDTGIVSILQRVGWRDSGHLFPYSELPTGLPDSPTQRYLYTVTLFSEAPLAVQTQQLSFYLHWLQQRYPDNTMILVGHSAGGVVARLSMLLHPELPINGLITIASPHLGTDKAELGYMLSHSPMSWAALFMGLGTINRSRELYRDLIRERPATDLFWLNRRPHPQATYISIIRANENEGFDSFVPAYSQNMNNVSALRGQSLVIPTHGDHALRWQDGILLADLLKRYFSSSR
ncbi:MAG: alpha/beta hydrolase [Thiotrichaceae bacterium]